MTSASREASSTGAPLYHFASATFSAICNLCADVCTSDRIGSVSALAAFIPQINVANRTRNPSHLRIDLARYIDRHPGLLHCFFFFLRRLVGTRSFGTVPELLQVERLL